MKIKDRKNKGLLVIVFCFVLLLIGVIYFNFPVNYVSIDINPSVMLGINKFDRVIKIEALNDDAKVLIDDLKLYGVDFITATNKIVKKANDMGYVLNDDENAILVSSYCNDNDKRLELQQKLYDNFNKNGIGSLIVDMQLTEEDVKKVNEYGVSYAKILFVKKALEDNPNLKFDDLIYLPAREIAKYIDEYDDIIINSHNGNSFKYHGNNLNK